MPQLGMPALWRLAIWGGLATFALFAAVIATYSNTGLQRQAAASPSGRISSGQAPPDQAPPSQATSGQAPSGQVNSGAGTSQPRIPVEFGPRPSETAEETRRLVVAVGALTADRDQALARIAALERNLDSVTGSIKRDRIANAQPAAAPAPPQAPSPPASAPTMARPEAPAPRPEQQVARPEPPAPPAPETAMAPTPTPPRLQQPVRPRRRRRRCRQSGGIRVHGARERASRAARGGGRPRGRCRRRAQLRRPAHTLAIDQEQRPGSRGAFIQW